MAFPECVKDDAYKRSGGQCECARQHTGATDAPHHGGRCPTKVTRHGAEYHHLVSEEAGGSDTLSNCQVLCVTCHRLVHS